MAKIRLDKNLTSKELSGKVPDTTRTRRDEAGQEFERGKMRKSKTRTFQEKN